VEEDTTPGTTKLRKRDVAGKEKALWKIYK